MKKQNNMSKNLREIEKANDKLKEYFEYYKNEVPTNARHTDIYEAISANNKLKKVVGKFIRLIRLK